MLCALSPYLGGFKETFTRPQLKLRLLRGVLLACSGLCSFYAFTYLDLAKAYAIIFAAPILVKIFSVFITKENIRLRSWAITMLGFIGVLIVVRLGIIPIDIGSAAALALAVFFSLGYVLSRYIEDKNQTMLSMALFQNAFLTIATAWPAYEVYQTIPIEFSLFAMMVLCFMSAMAICGSVLVAKSFSTAPTQIIAPIHYIQMIWGILLSALLFHEYPDGWTILGGGVICIAGLLLIRFSRPVSKAN